MSWTGAGSRHRAAKTGSIRTPDQEAHAACEVEYDPSSSLLICRATGATFDPKHGARAVASWAVKREITLRT